MNRISKERNEPEIILDTMVRKEFGQTEWKLSLKGSLFCPGKWTPNLSPVGCMSTLVLLTAVSEGVGWSEGVCASESIVELYKNTSAQLKDLPT